MKGTHVIDRGAFVALLLSLGSWSTAHPEALERPEYVGCSKPRWIEDERVITTRHDAIIIARIYASSLLSAAAVKDSEPLSAHLNGHVWTITGYVPKDAVGGSVVVRIDARSGCALNVFREK